MAVTIKDIARLAGTSRGTVDRVFNNRGRVSQEMADRIMAVATEHNYTPNESAKLLATSQSYTIGVVINSVGNKFFDDVMIGIERAKIDLARYKVSLDVVQLRGYSDIEQIEAIDSLIHRGVHGIAITPIESPLVKQRLDSLIRDGIPCVFINSDLDNVDRLATVGADNRENGLLAANIALLALDNNSNIAIVTGSHSNLGNTKRVNAFSQLIADGGKQTSIVDTVECHDDNDTAYKVVTDILGRHDNIHLIYFCAGGVTGGLNAIVDSGKPVRAITVDDNNAIRMGLESGMVLATITQDPVQQGYRPLELLAEYLALDRVPINRKIHTENRIRLAKSKW